MMATEVKIRLGCDGEWAFMAAVYDDGDDDIFIFNVVHAAGARNDGILLLH